MDNVQELNWKRFCYLPDAQNLLANLIQTFPDMKFDMYEDGEEMARYVFTSPNAPRIYIITGNTDKGDSAFNEEAGRILTRMCKPEGLDKDGPYQKGQALQMNLYVSYGYAFFYWSRKPVPIQMTVVPSSGGTGVRVSIPPSTQAAPLTA